MTPAEQLRAAKALIDTPERWTQCGRFREFRGATECFCAWGALDRATSRHGEALGWLELAIPTDATLPAFNDDPRTTHADIMKLFDDAIALAEAAQ